VPVLGALCGEEGPSRRLRRWARSGRGTSNWVCHGRSCPAVLLSLSLWERVKVRAARSAGAEPPAGCATAGLARPCSPPTRAHATGMASLAQAHYGVEWTCATAGLVRPCSRAVARLDSRFRRQQAKRSGASPTLGADLVVSPRGSGSLEWDFCVLFGFTPLLRGLCGRKGSV